MTAAVVAASDFSPSSRVAVMHAARIARERGADLHVIAVVDSEHVAAIAPATGMTPEAVETRAVESHRALLNVELDGAGVGPLPTERLHISAGRPGRRIVEECERLEAGLLVVGYQGKSERAGHGPGGVASRCVRHAPCDVLLTRLGGEGMFRRVVVGVDFGPATRELIARGAAMATGEGAELALVHACFNAFESMAYTGFGIEHLSMPQPTGEPYRSDLSELALGVRNDARCEVRTEVLPDTHYGRAISDWCAEYGADLVVVGTLGKPGLRYWLLGSTAEYVLRETGAAVLAVRGEG